MDLGIDGRVALVCGSSTGLGFACAEALAAAGAEVILNGRSAARLEPAVEAIVRQGGKARAVAADVTTAEGRQRLLAACPDPDILVNNAGGPPPGSFREFDEDAWLAALRANMIAPIELIRGVIDGMIARRWGRIVNITSTAVKSPLPMLDLSNGARSGLTGFIGGLARDVAPHGITVNNLLPGRFETERLRGYIAAVAQRQQQSVETAREQMLKTNPVGRFGQPPEFGAFCAFVASERAAYLTGQNFVLDGGEYRGW